METRGVEVNETENPAGEQTGENGPEGEENKTAETETSENGTPAPGIGFAIMAA